MKCAGYIASLRGSSRRVNGESLPIQDEPEGVRHAEMDDQRARSRIQGLRSGASPKKWAENKTLGSQGMLRRPRAVPISSEPVRRIGLGSSSGHDPKRTLSPCHTRATRRPAIQLKAKTILNGPKPFRRLLDSLTNHPRKESSFILCLFRSFRLILGLENTRRKLSAT